MKRGILNVELLVRYLEGTATTHEREQIESWKKESIQNKEEFDKMLCVWELGSRLESMQQIDVEKAREKVRDQIKQLDQKYKKLWHYWKSIAAILFFPVMLSLSYYFIMNDHSSDFTTHHQLEIYSAYGTRTRFSLPDGTIVWLNSGSRISYPEIFSSDKREVFLQGEALFEVKKNEKWPFYVNLGEICVKAVGTSFSVTAYSEEDIYETTLISGSIHLVKQDKLNHEIILSKMTPNQHAIYKKSDKEIKLSETIPVNDEVPKDEKGHVITNVKKTETDVYADNKYTSWIDGKLIFHDDPMNEVIRRLGRWYNVDVVLKDTLLYDFRYTATFTDETLQQVMDLLVLSAPLRYEISERTEKSDNSYTKEVVTLYLKIPEK